MLGDVVNPSSHQLSLELSALSPTGLRTQSCRVPGALVNPFSHNFLARTASAAACRVQRLCLGEAVGDHCWSTSVPGVRNAGCATQGCCFRVWLLSSAAAESWRDTGTGGAHIRVVFRKKLHSLFSSAALYFYCTSSEAQACRWASGSPLLHQPAGSQQPAFRRADRPARRQPAATRLTWMNEGHPCQSRLQSPLSLRHPDTLPASPSQVSAAATPDQAPLPVCAFLPT